MMINTHDFNDPREKKKRHELIYINRIVLILNNK